MQQESIDLKDENIVRNFDLDGLSVFNDANRSNYKNAGKNSSPNEVPAEETLIAFNSGSQAAFTRVHNDLYPSIYYFARRFVNSEDAGDLTADAFVKLWKMEKKFIRLQSVKIWLQVTVRNGCMNHFRYEKYKGERLRELLYLSDEISENYIADEETRAELIKRIDAEVEKLPPQSKKIFKMAWGDGLKNKEIAHQLGISANTVKSHKQKALAILRIEISFPILLIFLPLLLKLKLCC